jgi:hypothetical protein
MRFIAGYAVLPDLYDEWISFSSVMKQMKDGKPAVNAFESRPGRKHFRSGPACCDAKGA